MLSSPKDCILVASPLFGNILINSDKVLESNMRHLPIILHPRYLCIL